MRRRDRSERSIGEAVDFYRLRSIHVDEGDMPDLEWRDDVLWRGAQAASVDEYEVYRVEAVAIDDESTHVLKEFADADAAYQWMERAQEDLESMTKSEFESRYMADRQGLDRLAE